MKSYFNKKISYKNILKKYRFYFFIKFKKLKLFKHLNLQKKFFTQTLNFLQKKYFLRRKYFYTNFYKLNYPLTGSLIQPFTIEFKEKKQ
jgi:hypothetical protein